MSSNGGALLLREAGRRFGFGEMLGNCVIDHRDPTKVIHSYGSMIDARIVGIACGHEDCDDHDVLRHEPMLKMYCGKTHIALGIGLAACQRGIKTRFTTAAGIVHELIEARDEKRLLRLQKQMATVELLIIDELGFVPLSKTGAELFFELISQRYERGATIITSNLPFDEWTATFGEERLTGALLDRLTHHVHILEMNAQSYRLAQSKARKAG
jgi:hypothetical protein